MKTRFVWRGGQETWHETADGSPYWIVQVSEDHPDLPPGRHRFTRQAPATGIPIYYLEQGHGEEEDEKTGS